MLLAAIMKIIVSTALIGNNNLAGGHSNASSLKVCHLHVINPIEINNSFVICAV